MILTKPEFHIQGERNNLKQEDPKWGLLVCNST